MLETGSCLKNFQCYHINVSGIFTQLGMAIIKMTLTSFGYK
jgi:hypothetical protein